MPPVSTRASNFLDFLVCGYPAKVRAGRSLAVFAAYVDETGNDDRSPEIILVAIVSRVEKWKEFSDEWALVLDQPKKLKCYKARDARSLRGVFAGFNREEADRKTDDLTAVLTRHLEFARSSSLPREMFRKIVQQEVPRLNGRLHRYFKDPYYFCFQSVVGGVIREQLRQAGTGDRVVDFTFDNYGKVGKRCLALFEKAKAKWTKEWVAIMGRGIPGDDANILPLQAADLLVGHIRSWRSRPDESASEKTKELVRSKRLIHHSFTIQELEFFVSSLNVAYSVLRLSEINAEHDPSC